ncbi:MAG: nucleoside triphosphate pyrophosphohydrolase, partial [Clostridiales bacterium]|nr:nucleoside triphosphate pyrophosphohydrolase [Clostridiales bacterium]
MKQITVVSLGPGSREHLTLGALERMKNAEKAGKLILRTGLCDAAAYLKEHGFVFETLDDVHERCEDFEELAQECVKRVLEAAQENEVCYAVLDASQDETARKLAAAASCVILSGVTVTGPLLAALGAEDHAVQTADGLEITGVQQPLLITELDNRMLAGECKLKLLSWYDADTKVKFFPPSEAAVRGFTEIALSDLDRQKAYNHTCAAFIPVEGLLEKKRYDFYDLVPIMGILRAPGGCPWDREQTNTTLRPYLIEESYEVADAIDHEDWEHLADELGDVLLQVAFHANIAESTGTFELSDITTAICAKMIRRHRHIFGNDVCEDAAAVSRNWDKIKQEERQTKDQGEVLKDVAVGMEPLLRAAKVQKKARDVGFDWDDPRDALQKVHEEAEEVLQALDRNDSENLQEELGDLFFSCVNVSRLC